MWHIIDAQNDTELYKNILMAYELSLTLKYKSDDYRDCEIHKICYCV